MTYDVELRSRKRTRQAIVVAAVVLLVVVGLIVVLAMSGPGGSDKPKQVSGSPQATATSGAPQIAKADLDNLTWIQFQGVDLPHSTASGPRTRTKDLASGFAHGPLGAVVAAIHISTRATSEAGSDTFRSTIQNQMAGPLLAKFLADNERDYEQGRSQKGVAPGKPLSDGYVKTLGFRFEHYDERYAIVHLLARGPSPQGGSSDFDFRIELKWLNDDWKVLVPVDGKWDSAVTFAASKQGFTQFPGRT